MQPAMDLLGEEKPSPDLADASYGPSQTEEYDTETEEYDPQTEEVWETWVADHVLEWRDPYWPSPVYVRKDRSGDFHTYPCLGGPFHSLDEVGSAVVSGALDSGIDMSAKLSKLSPRERLVQKYLYWPDGTIKLRTRAEKAKREDEELHKLVEALLDKHNDNGGCVGELQDIVHWQSICEGFDKWYHQLNIRLKTKGSSDGAGSAELFFAEVACDQNRHMLGYYIRALFRLAMTARDKVICHGCFNNGSADMQHPPACKFKGGHEDIYFPRGFGPCNEKKWRKSDNNLHILLHDIVHWQSICEGFDKWYHHLNIRLKTKGSSDGVGSANLFFAEVACDQNRHMLGYYIRALFMVGTDNKDDKVICHGCLNNGSTDMKHPPPSKFKGGHKDIYFPSGFGPCNEKKCRGMDNNEEQVQKLKEAKIQKMFNYVDDAAYMDNLRNKRLHNPIDITMEEVEEMLREN